ncbi:hypothetical protein [Streptomyces sp. NPDC020917]|uniref:hypothetical protein n=1 Tax=Streptomyces sp. NPDC020917 TaxID=3365102 RepID=UPI0037A99480
MRIVDARSGLPGEIRRARGGLLRVCAHTARGAGPSSLGNLRALLVTDVLFRVAEHVDGLQAMVGYADADLPESDVKEQADAARRLGIRPPDVHADPDDLGDAFGGPVHVHVGAARAGVPAMGNGGLYVAAGPVSAPAFAGRQTDSRHAPERRAPDRPDDGRPDNGGPNNGGPNNGGRDPLALRLALLQDPHSGTAHLTPDTLSRAEALLGRWRERVAAWADAASRPMHAETVRRVHDACREDLDTAAVLAALSRLETETDVPDGAKFETFVHADQVLGLELPRDIGRGPSPGARPAGSG